MINGFSANCPNHLVLFVVSKRLGRYLDYYLEEDFNYEQIESHVNYIQNFINIFLLS